MDNIEKENFDMLNLKQKGQAVFLESGKFLTSRNYYNQKLVLYDMGKFYAEVWYEPDSNKIHQILPLPLEDKTIDLYIDASIKSKNGNKIP